MEAVAEHGRVRILESCLLRGQPWDGEFGRRQYKRACKLAENNGRETIKWILERLWIETGTRLLHPASNDGNGSGIDEPMTRVEIGSISST